MTRTELLQIIGNGESSFIEFKRDTIDSRALAKELVAFCNSGGGRVLLGVDDDGSISGLSRANLEEWAMTVSRDKIRPAILPTYEVIRDVEPGKDVAVVAVEPGWTVHNVRHNNHAYYYIRAGTLSREADIEELQRLFQRRGSVRFETQPVAGSGFADLSQPRLTDYFTNIRGQVVPPLGDVGGWERLLLNTEFLVESGSDGTHACSVAGLLLFGAAHRRFLPYATIDLAVFPGVEKEYDAVFRDTADSCLVRLSNERGDMVMPGIVDQTMSMLQPYLSAEKLEGSIRTRRWDYPKAAIREALVNAVVHRDYLLASTSIEVSVYADRLEIVSPGKPPNGITPNRMRAGCRAARNQLLKDVMRDYGYMEHMGMGIPRKIIKLMQEEVGTVPDLLVGEESFSLVLRKAPPQTVERQNIEHRTSNFQRRTSNV